MYRTTKINQWSNNVSVGGKEKPQRSAERKS